MREHINLLILDEPTNHLDIASREWLEDALGEYEEALLFVSHDRYFIERFATKIWLLENGAITEYICSYDEFLRRREAETANAEKLLRLQQAQKSTEAKLADAAKRSGSVKPKNIEKQLERIERDIAYAELDVARIDEDIEIYSSDYERLNELYVQKQSAQSKLDALYKEWETLSA